MNLTPRAWRFLIAHPVRTWRHLQACRAPWPALPATVPASVYLPAVAAITEAETIVDAEALRIAKLEHPTAKGRL